MNTIQIINDQTDLRKEEKTDLYIRTFWEEPWNEWYQCVDCETLYPLSQIQKEEIKQCTCGGILEAFYDPTEVSNSRNKRTQKEGYIWKLAQTLQWEMIWFIMWWKSNLEQLNTEKLWLDEIAFEKLLTSLNQKYENFDDQNIFYAADIWVKKDVRWQGIASKLYTAREQSIIESGMQYILVRTTKKADKPYKWYKREWFEDIFEYNDQQDRVILVKKV